MQAYRESPMTAPEARFYKDQIRTNKNIRDFQGTDCISHVAPQPNALNNADHKRQARMLKSNIEMYPAQRDGDTFLSPAKKVNPARNQFAASTDLYMNRHETSPQKKNTLVKRGELIGGGYVKPMDTQTMWNSQKQYGSQAKQVRIIGSLHSKGTTQSIHGFRDNDVTSALVNAKHSSLMIMNARTREVNKHKAQVSWVHGKGTPLTLQ